MNNQIYQNSVFMPQSGILAIDKPKGLSSAQVVARVKKNLGPKKAGHTGTLDPFATGLLLCGINQGTRISGLFLGSHKRYKTKICLGAETDTYDLSGSIVFTASQGSLKSLTEKKITETVSSFIGVQKQIPPAFSALKHKGRPLYEWARKGSPIQKPAREIEIFDICITNIDLNVSLPVLELDIFCSSGTYIRSLGFDIGRKLDCGAHLTELSRTQSGSFHLKDAVSLKGFEALGKEDQKRNIVPINKCIEFIPAIYADQKTAEKIKYGRKLFRTDFQSDPRPPVLAAQNSTALDYSGPLIRVVGGKKGGKGEEVLALVQKSEPGGEYIYSCVFST